MLHSEYTLLYIHIHLHISIKQKTEMRKGFSQSPIILLLPELAEEQGITRTYSSVHKGPRSGCIASNYRSRQGRLPEKAQASDH